MYKHEYQGSSVKQMSNYSRLAGIPIGSQSNGIVSQNSYIVPKYCPSGDQPNYPPRPDTLTHGRQFSGGYFTMKSAYPYADCSGCRTTFVERPCVGDIQCDGLPEPVAPQPVVPDVAELPPVETVISQPIPEPVAPQPVVSEPVAPQPQELVEEPVVEGYGRVGRPSLRSKINRAIQRQRSLGRRH